MTDLLCVPFRTAVEVVGFENELANLIESISYQSASFFQDDVRCVCDTRRSLHKSEASSMDYLQLLYRYYGYVKQLKMKFLDHQVQLTWLDTLSGGGGRGSKLVSQSWKFEELNVVFNIGAAYSLLAVSCNNGSPESLKQSSQYFQYSAGCYQYMMDNLNNIPNTNFDENLANCLINLMLAQSQECFWFRAVQDNHKDSLLGKLAKQVSDYYLIALKHCKATSYTYKDWSKYMETKHFYFSAVSYYRNALALYMKQKYGEAIKSLRTAIAFLQTTDEKLVSQKSHFMQQLQTKLLDLEKDNDFIYLQPIPNEICGLKGVSMVKVIVPTELTEPSTQHPVFKELIPLDVMEFCTAYNAKQEYYVLHNVVEPIKALNKILLQSLPNKEIPRDALKVPAEELEACHLSFVDMEHNHNIIVSELQEIKKLLDDERNIDQDMRTKYGTIQWTREASSDCNKELVAAWEKLLDFVQQGVKVDQETHELFDSVDKELLVSPINLPESNLPTQKMVRDTLQKREEMIRKVQAKSESHRIMGRIVSYYKKTGEMQNFEKIYAEHMDVFEDDIKFVNECRKENKRLTERLHEDANAGEASLKRLDPQDLYLEDRRHSFKLFQEVKENIISGTEFYKNLAENADQLRRKVEDYVNQRNSEAKEIEGKLVM